MRAKIGRDCETPLSLVTFITSRAINEGVKSINEYRTTGKDSGNPLTPLVWMREHSLMFCIFLGSTFVLLLILSMAVGLPLVEWLVLLVGSDWQRILSSTFAFTTFLDLTRWIAPPTSRLRYLAYSEEH